ncbi:MAG: hypothetical protein LQ352_000118 [Teloschistes flavicans]|nr:MAG: hypothetical protein LQ352_000118 [Teloschistes flavicans]
MHIHVTTVSKSSAPLFFFSLASLCIDLASLVLAFRTTLKLEGYEKQLFARLVDRSKVANISEEERADVVRLRDELAATRQGMDICSRAHEHLKDNVSTIDNYATGDAVQFMVSTNEKTIHAMTRFNRSLGVWQALQFLVQNLEALLLRAEPGLSLELMLSQEKSLIRSLKNNTGEGSSSHLTVFPMHLRLVPGQRRRVQAARLERERRAAEEEKRKEAAAQRKLRTLGVCVAGFWWIKQAGGYRCVGGSHYVSDAQLGLG